ncbi:general transcription factor II-I repeat domain-containing protein 2A-like isoform 1-T2 [Vipera latastei]
MIIRGYNVKNPTILTEIESHERNQSNNCSLESSTSLHFLTEVSVAQQRKIKNKYIGKQIKVLINKLDVNKHYRSQTKEDYRYICRETCVPIFKPPKMVKQKVDFERRCFQKWWEPEYLFVDIEDKAVCLVCGATVAVFKEYNLRRHYKTKHQDKYKNLNMEQKAQKVEDLKKSLMSWQHMFKKTKSQSEASVKASFIVAEEIAKSARPFTEGEFLKHCMIKVCKVMCPDQKQAFLNISLSRNTVVDRICELATDLQGQLVEKGKEFIAYSLAVDESIDVSDTAQLTIFIRGVDSGLCITEELLDVKSLHGTTMGKDIFEAVSKSIHDMKLPWDKLIGLTTDGAPSMCREKSGLVGRMRDKMKSENCTGELTAYHCIIHQETLCGKALKMDHVMHTVTKTVNFIFYFIYFYFNPIYIPPFSEDSGRLTLLSTNQCA